MQNAGNNKNFSPVVELKNKPFKIYCLDFITLLYWLHGAITPINNLAKTFLSVKNHILFLSDSSS